MPAWNFVFNKVPNRHCCLIVRCQLIQLTKPNTYSASPGGFEPLTPRLGGECSIQLSYEDMSDFWLKIRLSGTFQSFRIGNRLFNYLCFLDELLHPTFLDTFAFGGKLYNTYFDRFELSSSFSHSSKASGKPLP